KPFVDESRPAAASVGYLPLRPPVEPARKPLLTPDQIAAREAGIAGAPVPASKAKAADPKCAKPARCKAARAR
ncbi:MAG: hypothetical protein KGQ28_07240, partial [Hyphomicrobiales bacterium]|nr:hypothetical protein [Hyphomicrobiales bacterium]